MHTHAQRATRMNVCKHTITLTHTHAVTVTSQTPSCCFVVIYYPFCTQWSHEISLAFDTRTHTHRHTHSHTHTLGSVTPSSSRRPGMLPNRDLFGLISTESLGRAQEGRLGWPAEGCERPTGGRLPQTHTGRGRSL